MNEYSWDNSAKDTLLGNENKLSIEEIIELYLQRCREVKDKFNNDIKYFYPFEIRVSQIINNVLEQYLDGQVGIDSFEIVDGISNKLEGIESNAINSNEEFDSYYDCIRVNLADLWKRQESFWEQRGLQLDDNNNFYFPNILIDQNMNIISSVSKDTYTSIFNEERRYGIPVCGDDLMDKVVEELNKHKKELISLKKQSDKYKSSNMIQVEKRKQECLEYLNGIVIALDNGIRLNLNIGEEAFDMSKFDPSFVVLKNVGILGQEEIIDAHGLSYNNKNQYLLSSSILDHDKIYNYQEYKDDKQSIKEKRKRLSYMTDSKGARELLIPFDKINIGEEVRIRKVNSEREAVEYKKRRLEEKLATTGKYISLAKKCEFSDLEAKRFCNKMPIKEEELLEKGEDGILRIKSFFIDYLKYFDLSFITFKDADIRGIDFTNCNAYSLIPNERFGLQECTVPLDMVGETDKLFNVSNVPLYGTKFVCSNDDSLLRFYPSSFADALIDENTVFPEQMKKSIDEMRASKEKEKKEIDLEDTLDFGFPVFSFEELPIKTPSRELTEKEHELLDKAMELDRQAKQASVDLKEETKNVLLDYLTSMDEYNNLGGSTQEYYNKLYINEELLFDTNEEGKLCVREELKEYLKYFDLYRFTFEGVNIDGLDFTNCNLGLFALDKVDSAVDVRIPGELLSSNAKLENVDIRGSDFSYSNSMVAMQNPITFIDFTGAIMDEYTVLPQEYEESKKDKEKSEIKLTLNPDDIPETPSLFDFDDNVQSRIK